MKNLQSILGVLAGALGVANLTQLQASAVEVQGVARCLNFQVVLEMREARQELEQLVSGRGRVERCLPWAPWLHAARCAASAQAVLSHASCPAAWRACGISQACLTLPAHRARMSSVGRPGRRTCCVRSSHALGSRRYGAGLRACPH